MTVDYTKLYNRDGAPPGRAVYHYDTIDHPDVVEAANYFNNVAGDQNLAVGDRIVMAQWSATPYASGSTISRQMAFRVTNVIPRTAAASAGAVNIAQELTTELLSSGT
jgi:hypothetical protein